MRFIDYIVILVGIVLFFLLGYAAGADAETDAETDAGTITASCYGAESGPVTASGEKFEPAGHTAASRTLPFGTRLLVRHGTRSVAVTVNDYGPAEWTRRDIDLSMGACEVIGLVEKGAGPVEVEQVESASEASGVSELPKTSGPG